MKPGGGEAAMKCYATTDAKYAVANRDAFLPWLEKMCASMTAEGDAKGD